MGLLDLFKSKPPALRPDPVLRWFGKMPTYADYYASPTDADWAAEFNDWLLKGYDLYHNRARTSGAGDARRTELPRLPVSGCAIRLPKSGMTVFASVMDCGGDSEGRPFPFSFYVGIPSEQWPGPDCGRLFGAMRVVRALMELRSEVYRFFRSPGRFDDVFGGRRIELDGLTAGEVGTTWRTQARDLEFVDWFNLISAGSKAPSLAAWVERANAKGRQIKAHDGDAFEPTLRFPLTWARPIDAQVAGWLRWLELHMSLEDRFMSVIATGGDEGPTGYLAIAARPVITQDFLLLTSQAGTVPYLDDLATQLIEPMTDDAGPASRSGTASEDADSAAEAMATGLKTWHDFVECAPERS